MVLMMPRTLATVATATIWPRRKRRKRWGCTIRSRSGRGRLLLRLHWLVLRLLSMLLVDLLRVLWPLEVRLGL
jgi:hypothetical protein